MTREELCSHHIEALRRIAFAQQSGGIENDVAWQLFRFVNRRLLEALRELAGGDEERASQLVLEALIEERKWIEVHP